MSRTFATSAVDLWDACTNPERLARWIGAASGELREGGDVRLEMSPNGEDGATISVVRCNPPRRLVIGWKRAGEPDSLVELLIDPVGDDGCTLTLEHIALAGDLPVQYGAGWEDHLVRLGALLDGDDPQSSSFAGLDQQAAARWRAVLEEQEPGGRWPVFTAADAGSTIRAMHSYRADAATVWAAIASPEVLAGWFGQLTGDLDVGGEWTVEFDGGTACGTIAACQPERRIVTSWRWAHESAASPASTVTIELRPGSGGGTIVEILETEAGAHAAGYAAGWHAHLGGLERYLTTARTNEADWQADWTLAMAMLRP